jgi:fibronectin-binding autotransporter adhesin
VIVAAAGALGNSSNGIDLDNGGYLEFSNGLSINNNIALGAGVNKIDAGVYGVSGFDIGYGGVVSGGSSSVLDLTGGDLITTSNSASDIGTINITGGRLLAYGNGIFGSDVAINVDNGGTLDFAVGGISNAITLADGSALENRTGGNAVLSNVTFPTTGTVTLGSDDVGGGAMTIKSNIDLAGPLTLNINSWHGSNTPVYLTGTISDSGALTFNPGPTGVSPLHISGPNNYSGPTTINVPLVYTDNDYSAFGTSVVTLNGVTLYIPAGYGGTALNNEFILGTGTNTFNGPDNIDTFAGYVVNGDVANPADTNGGTVLHLVGDNNTINPTASSVSDYSTLDIDSGRTFLMGPYGLNFIANNTTVNIAAYTTLDFDIGGSVNPGNHFTLGNGGGFSLRDDYGTPTVTLTDVALPTSGSFFLGSDDEGNERGSITITSDLALTGDISIGADDSGGSTVVGTLSGKITGNHDVTVTNGPHGPGILAFTGTNGYTGSTSVTGGATLRVDGDNSATGAGYNIGNGVLQIGSGGSIPTAANVVEGSTVSVTVTNSDNTTTTTVYQYSGALVLGDANGAVDQTVASITTAGSGTSNTIYNGNTHDTTDSSLNVDYDSVGGTDTYTGTIGSSTTNGNNLSLTKSGRGTLALEGTNTYTGGTTVAAGKLAVDGSIAGNAVVDSGAEIGGHGTIAGIISGAGAVGPGNSPGILTASEVDPSLGTSFNFEFSLQGPPDYNDPSASVNDVLHLTGATPFAFALTSSNTINLYFSGGGVFEGGFFVDGSDSLTPDVLDTDAKVNYYVINNRTGATSYDGNSYDLTSGTAIVIPATFGASDTTGYTEEFTVVPEPSTYTLMGLGGLAFLFVRRRIKS